MGKLTDALKKAAEERMALLGEREERKEFKYEFVARKTVDSKIDPRIVAFYDAYSPITEQYRTLRTNLQNLKQNNPVKAITLTSSINAEGKSITSVNLAISMAKDLDKKRILLIDGDLRRSRICRYLGITAEKGLSELISENANVDEALLNINEVENLTILPAGKHPQNPAELLSSLKMRSLINLFKNKYDYVIIDAPPIIPVTDAGLIGAQTDGVVMVIQANRTQKRTIKHSQDLLRQANSKLLGYILTNVQYHIPDYIYRYL